MSKNLSEKKNDSVWARIETGIQGCFSGGETSLEISFESTGKCAVEITFDGKKNKFLINKYKADEFLEKIIFLGRKPEVLSESGWTKSVRVKVEWQNLTFAEERSGKISAISNEWTIAEMEEYLPKIKDAAVAEKVKETLAKGLYRRAIEINLETEKFVKCLF